jgi:hypothetical protein
LSLLAFKKSLFAGVLDGGDSEIFLGGSRLAKFMESVDAVVRMPEEPQPPTRAPVTTPDKRRSSPTTMGAAVVPASVATTSGTVEPISGNDTDTGQATNRPARAQDRDVPAASTPNPWAPLLEAGLKWVEALAVASSQDDGQRSSSNEPPTISAPWIERDARTGRSYLKLPVPEPVAIRQLGAALQRLLLGSASAAGTEPIAAAVAGEPPSSNA